MFDLDHMPRAIARFALFALALGLSAAALAAPSPASAPALPASPVVAAHRAAVPPSASVSVPTAIKLPDAAAAPVTAPEAAPNVMAGDGAPANDALTDSGAVGPFTKPVVEISAKKADLSISGDGQSAEAEFDFTIGLDRRNPETGKPVYLAKLSRIYEPLDTSEIRSVLLWWTTPSGHTSSFAISPLDAGDWASLVEPADEAGDHRLSLLVIFDDTDPTRARELRQEYDLSMPDMFLTLTGTHKLVPPSAAPPTTTAPVPVAAPEPSRLSIPLTILLLALLNIGLAAAVGATLFSERIIPGRLKQWLHPEAPEDLSIESVVKMFTSAGMLGENRQPLPMPGAKPAGAGPLDPVDENAPAKEAAKAKHAAGAEAEAAETEPLRSAAGEEIFSLSDEDLNDMLNDAKPGAAPKAAPRQIDDEPTVERAEVAVPSAAEAVKSASLAPAEAAKDEAVARNAPKTEAKEETKAPIRETPKEVPLNWKAATGIAPKAMKKPEAKPEPAVKSDADFDEASMRKLASSAKLQEDTAPATESAAEPASATASAAASMAADESEDFPIDVEAEELLAASKEKKEFQRSMVSEMP